MLSGNDFSKRPRFSEEEVEVEERDEELFVTEEEREWDYAPRAEETAPTSELWARGGGLSTSHIVPPFNPDLAGLVPFVRLLKDMAPDNRGGKSKSPGKRGKKSAAAGKDEKAASKEIKSEAKEEGEEGEGDCKEEVRENEDIVDKIRRLTGIVMRDPEAARQRWSEESLEDECYMRDEPSLHLVSETQDSIGRRAVAVSTILRFVASRTANVSVFGTRYF